MLGQLDQLGELRRIGIGVEIEAETNVLERDRHRVVDYQFSPRMTHLPAAKPNSNSFLSSDLQASFLQNLWPKPASHTDSEETISQLVVAIKESSDDDPRYIKAFVPLGHE